MNFFSESGRNNTSTFSLYLMFCDRFTPVALRSKHFKTFTLDVRSKESCNPLKIPPFCSIFYKL